MGGDTTSSKYNNANGTYQGLTWAWTGPLSFSSASQNAITNQTGIYRLIVTQKSNGCKDTAMTNVLDTLTGNTLSANEVTFTAARDNKGKIKTTWAVRGESINSFELYRSTDGNTFKSIAVIIPDAAAIIKKNNYTDDVSTLNAGNVFYKLKWTDKSGKIYFSTIVKVGLGETITSTLALWPNPVVESATVTFTSFNRGISAVQIIDFSGKVVMQKNIQIQEGINNIQLSSLSWLQRGMYTIRLINADNVLTNSFLKTN